MVARDIGNEKPSDKTLAIQAELCPKSGQVRTTFRLFEQKLSEVKPSSDSFPAGRAKAVRSKTKFVQLSGHTSKSCPK
ncbi:hypothetical protein [Bacillus sp. ISL-55]|uniref:hypothetical protein n=1 Tax=Bacillus sp. ISL-55 TaxID=2819134 RepID=UPI001BE77E53|nr:hypothetical protein [Bacillus sp. ISL-55]MBT2692036.1 hypothetical protein [Bacillus sp. ISL-55]